MKTVLIFLFTGLALSEMLAKRIPNFAGPYRAIIRRCHNDTDEFNSTGDVWFDLHVTHPKIHQFQYGWGVTGNAIDVDDKLNVEVRMSKWANNQWKRNAFVMKLTGACTPGHTFAKSLMPFYFGDDAGKCPIKTGWRIIRNRTADLQFPSVPVFPYGRWLFTVAVFRAKEVVGLLAVDCETVPKL